MVRDLIKGMHQAGAQVTLVVLSERVSHELLEGVALVTLPLAMNTRAERRQRYARHAALLNDWLSGWLSDRQEGQTSGFNLVVAHLHHAHQVVSRSCLASTAWYCLHTDPVVELLGNKRGLGRWLKQRKVQALYGDRRVLAVSQGILDSMASRLRIRMARQVAVHNPIDMARIRELAAERIDDVPPDYLVFVGRINQRQKRFDRLFDAYRDSGVQLPLVVVGAGGDLPAVKAMAESRGVADRVHFLGSRTNPYPYMQHARALLLSSDYEGFALVLAEALALGTPTISVDCPSGPAEILCEGLADCIVPLDDDAAFARTIQWAVEHPPRVPTEICDRFRLATVVERYLALAEPHSEQR
ncbi:Glycosyltransferase involved in cell wall bisynthesis [Halomonas cupida]|uniref:Glycosyltransferase involved in cell wall bisynthesis n=1 Tax=Halomonas cupida TaxID=44933 RepID=A0A1M7LUD0_9GAMM|nr:Glycosyltransferase involved in cell wall bisynthesis [Halomonas cupida]